LFVLAACQPGGDANTGHTIPAATAASLQQALADAASSHKLVVVDFFTTWCGPCKRLERETWGNAEVRKWFDGHALLVKLDAEKEAATAERFHVEAYPTIVFLAPDGTEKDRLVGFREPAKFLEEVAQISVGKTSLQRANDKFAGHENDPMERGQFAKELARQGKYAEALEHYLWCFDHGAQTNPAYGGVRVSFLVSDIAELAKKYEPARQALEERRAAALKKLENGDGGNDEAMDLASIDRVLEQQQRTLADYDRLRAGGRLDKTAESWLRHSLVELLAEQRRYGEVLQSCGNKTDKAVRAKLSIAQRGESLGLGDAKEAGLPDLRDMQRDSTVEGCADYYEAELGAGAPEKADAIAATLIEFHPKATTYSTLITRAVRAEKPDSARALFAQAREKLEGKELDGVLGAALKIPLK
jgi:thioredoxin-like negative regulator of GroEL